MKPSTWSNWLGRNAASLALLRTSVVNWNDRQHLLFVSKRSASKTYGFQASKTSRRTCQVASFPGIMREGIVCLNWIRHRGWSWSTKENFRGKHHISKGKPWGFTAWRSPNEWHVWKWVGLVGHIPAIVAMDGEHLVVWIHEMEWGHIISRHIFHPQDNPEMEDPSVKRSTTETRVSTCFGCSARASQVYGWNCAFLIP